jgi:small GTP-binding protein
MERVTIRAVVIGDSAVGKTSIINRYLQKYDFDPHEANTIGAMYDSHEIQRENRIIELQIWDTAGQEQYRSLGSTYFRNAHGSVVVFDLTARASYQNLEYWVDSFRSVAGRDRPALIIGNKSDLKHTRQVTWDEASDWAIEHSCQYLETSALSGEGIDVAFETLIDELVSLTAQPERQTLDDHGGDGTIVTEPPANKPCC